MCPYCWRIIKIWAYWLFFFTLLISSISLLPFQPSGKRIKHKNKIWASERYLKSSKTNKSNNFKPFHIKRIQWSSEIDINLQHKIMIIKHKLYYFFICLVINPFLNFFIIWWFKYIYWFIKYKFIKIQIIVLFVYWRFLLIFIFY